MITATQVLKTEAFQKIAVIDSLQFIADNNGRTLEQAVQAFAAGHDGVTKQVEELVLAAAETITEEMNKG